MRLRCSANRIHAFEHDSRGMKGASLQVSLAAACDLV